MRHRHRCRPTQIYCILIPYHRASTVVSLVRWNVGTLKPSNKIVFATKINRTKVASGLFMELINIRNRIAQLKTTINSVVVFCFSLQKIRTILKRIKTIHFHFVPNILQTQT